MATIGVPQCGDKNRADVGWPKKIKPGCGSDIHAIQYMDGNGRPSVCHLCPRCDGLFDA